MSAPELPEEADTLLLEDGKVRLRIISDPRWENVPSGSLPTLVPAGAAPAPVMVVADIGAVYGGGDVLLKDLQQMPGRGARIAMGELGTVLSEVLDGTLRFDDLVRGMDVDGCYRGGGGRPAVPVPTEVVRTGYPMLPDGDSWSRWPMPGRAASRAVRCPWSTCTTLRGSSPCSRSGWSARWTAPWNWPT